MRHLKTGRKLGVDGSHRKAMLRNMVDSLIVSGRIKTTVTRAKELRKLADKMITYAKRDTLHTKRMALQVLRTKDAFVKLFSEYKEQFAGRSGGYTRIIKLGSRLGDNAPMAYIEYVADDLTDKKTTGRRRRKKKKATNTVVETKTTTENLATTSEEVKTAESVETKETTETLEQKAEATESNAELKETKIEEENKETEVLKAKTEEKSVSEEVEVSNNQVEEKETTKEETK